MQYSRSYTLSSLKAPPADAVHGLFLVHEASPRYWAFIQLQWIERVIESPEREEAQSDGRFRLWASIEEMDGRYLRVILLPDRRTVHNAFFDRSFRT